VVMQRPLPPQHRLHRHPHSMQRPWSRDLAVIGTAAAPIVALLRLPTSRPSQIRSRP
jgi:hypothetical protein